MNYKNKKIKKIKNITFLFIYNFMSLKINISYNIIIKLLLL